MPSEPKAVANYFLEKAKEAGRALTPLQVIKLVYIAHGWHLALAGEPLISEVPQAWKYGPVISSLYHDLKGYGNGPVTSPLMDEFGSMENDWVPEAAALPNDKNVRGLLDRVWKIYGGYSGMTLSALTHQVGTPWHSVWNSVGQNFKGSEISNEKIKEHYLDLKRKNEQRRQQLSAA